MKDIARLDISAYCQKSVTEVFATMLSMDAERFDVGSEDDLEGERVVGSVSFVGAIMGTVSIHMAADFARMATAAMLGMDYDDVQAKEEVHDVVGELSNMVGGNLKSRFCDDGFPCSLSLPSITTGSHFRIKCRDLTRHDRFGFHCQEHTVIVEVFLKEGSC
ncbi:MAG TPA: chemotaxis protein CheX [Thermodesulfobacteriota bacterium]|nr:chemotaxis protein CheX [Deltaproteobacteria bacterium]HOC39531.1 chemotaxis protein CheX [Thermodesulfobacteriota bacterium]